MIVPAVAVAAGCGTVRDMVRDFQHIQSCVTQRSGAQSINISIGTKRFTIGLVNSPMDTLPAEARAAAARQVAECVRDNYHRYGTLDDVAITFTKQSKIGVAKVSTTTASLVFTTKVLGPAPAGADSAAGRAKAAN
ncbi:MAG: hypothetical protein ACHQX4_04780 [Gemmatimonadales bacterium]